MKYFLVTGILILCFSCNQTDRVLQKSSLELTNGWEFCKKGDSTYYAAQVPGQVHLDLWKNGLIDDPYWQDNELEQRWIENEDWIYRTEFTIDQNLLSNKHVEIHFEGLDTYADVFVNDENILSARNMFRTWEVDVKPHLRLGINELKLVFHSPISQNKERLERYPYLLPSGNEAEDIPIKVASFTRKAAYHFGWDWGPRFVTAGIWKPVNLTSWNDAKIISAYTRTLNIDSNQASMKTIVELECSLKGNYKLLIGEELISVFLSEGHNVISHDFTVEDPKLWWTNGLGEPNLNSQHIKLFRKGVLLDSISDRFGIRTIELVNEPDSIGTSFYFVLNGQPVFMKGANYIPQDMFLSRVTPQKYQQLLSMVVEANMNMLRVWGGGIYEHDQFYDLCDEKGILVWQDFMFAGSLYPDEENFRKNITQEVIDNVKRLRSHPSIALWCGNNEIEVAWNNWGWQKQYGYTKRDSLEIWNNYVYIFQELLPKLVSQYHPDISYTSTSPLSNWGTTENFNHSSMHYWGVWHGREPFENFADNVGRFMVEYGFQSYPELSTLEKVIADTNLYLNSPMIEHRQKSYIGNGLISKHINQYYEASSAFDDFVSLSQKTQAKGMRMAIQAHMEQAPHCMGTLFWQLNDCWPGPSWSVLDYYGNKKMAFDTVALEFQKN